MHVPGTNKPASSMSRERGVEAKRVAARALAPPRDRPTRTNQDHENRPHGRRKAMGG